MSIDKSWVPTIFLLLTIILFFIIWKPNISIVCYTFNEKIDKLQRITRVKCGNKEHYCFVEIVNFIQNEVDCKNNVTCNNKNQRKARQIAIGGCTEKCKKVSLHCNIKFSKTNTTCCCDADDCNKFNFLTKD
uniref:Activin_recp domain-containing protein n=1 Tax=Parastrongyloides trichosuri TaxID=131310 RepID=A0A0N5A4K9_PARTI